jgi:hypothetical protein
MSDLVMFQPVRALDRNGAFAPGALARFYEPGTLTPRTVYTDSALTTAHAIPLVADASGVFAPVYTSGLVKAVVTDADGVTLPKGSMDPAFTIPASGAAASSISFDATATVPHANVQEAIEGVDADLRATPGGNGIYARTSATSTAARTITGTADQITFTNGDGVAGNPTAALVLASQAEAEAGTDANKVMAAARVKESIDYRRRVYQVSQTAASGTAAPDSALATWNHRVVNTEDIDELTGASISAGVVTLPAGVYDVSATATAFAVGNHRARLYDVTNSAALLQGMNANAPGANWQTAAILMGRITLSAETQVRLEHFTQSAATSGLGIPASTGASEVYAVLRFEWLRAS